MPLQKRPHIEPRRWRPHSRRPLRRCRRLRLQLLRRRRLRQRVRLQVKLRARPESVERLPRRLGLGLLGHAPLEVGRPRQLALYELLRLGHLLRQLLGLLAQPGPPILEGAVMALLLGREAQGEVLRELRRRLQLLGADRQSAELQFA